MKFKSYHTNGYWLWLGILAFLLLGGFNFLGKILPGLLAIGVQLLPFLLIFWVIRAITRSKRLGSAAGNLDHSRFVELLVRMMIHIAHADGKLDTREIQTVHSFFQIHLRYSGSQLLWVDDLIKEATHHPYPLEELCQTCNQYFDYEAKLMVIQLIYQIAFADHLLASGEEKAIHQIVQLLQISPIDHHRIEALFKPAKNKEDQWYEVLGVPKTAHADDLKKAYRTLSKEYHPDRVHHLDPEFQKAAEEKMRRINEAYEHLKKKHSV